MAIVHLGPACVKAFLDSLSEFGVDEKDYPFTADMTHIVQEVLTDNKRWCVMMGQSAIKNEVKALEHACSEAGMGNTGCDWDKTKLEDEGGLSYLLREYTHKELISSKHEFHDEKEGKTFLEKLRKGGSKITDLLNNISEKDKWVKPFFRKLILPSKNAQWSKAMSSGSHILSTGAGGLKFSAYEAFTAEKKESLYTITYPTLRFESAEQEKKFIEEMVKVKTVVNSLFCFAGSAKQYKKFLKDNFG